MDRAPKEPGKRASDLQSADFDDRGFPSDCREVALMTIDESWRLWSAGESVPDQVGNITALLFASMLRPYFPCPGAQPLAIIAKPPNEAVATPAE